MDKAKGNPLYKKNQSYSSIDEVKDDNKAYSKTRRHNAFSKASPKRPAHRKELRRVRLERPQFKRAQLRRNQSSKLQIGREQPFRLQLPRRRSFRSLIVACQLKRCRFGQRLTRGHRSGVVQHGRLLNPSSENPAHHSSAAVPHLRGHR